MSANRVLVLLLPLILFSHTVAAVPSKLSDTGLYSSIEQKKVSSSNQFYVPQYPLWTDGALKSRWIFLPPDKKIDTSNPDHWSFPIGTKIWKEFSFLVSGKAIRIETRFMEKTSEEEWGFGSYLWNPLETEALLAPEEGVKDHVPTSATTTHDIPSVADCMRCHRRQGDGVLGFDAIQLSNDSDPLALHKENQPDHALTLKRLIETSLVSENAPSFNNGNIRIPTQSPRTRTVLGYFHSNCASCHNPRGSSMHISLNFQHSILVDEESQLPALMTSVNKKCQIFAFPGEPKPMRIEFGSPERSAIWQMMRSQDLNHMPPIGTKILDQKAVDLIRSWISDH